MTKTTTTVTRAQWATDAGREEIEAAVIHALDGRGREDVHAGAGLLSWLNEAFGAVKAATIGDLADSVTEDYDSNQECPECGGGYLDCPGEVHCTCHAVPTAQCPATLKRKEEVSRG